MIDEQNEDRLSSDAETTGDVTPGDVTQIADSSGPNVPDHIDEFRINRVIASGGMGTVYLATQLNPRRNVALKLMKKGLVSESTLRRFEFESQILARLHHSNIAQVKKSWYAHGWRYRGSVLRYGIDSVSSSD